jgi:hypothetical protein
MQPHIYLYTKSYIKTELNLRKSAFKMGRQTIACILVALYVVHVQADFGIPGYSFRNIDEKGNHTGKFGNYISDTNINDNI